MFIDSFNAVLHFLLVDVYRILTDNFTSYKLNCIYYMFRNSLRAIFLFTTLFTLDIHKFHRHNNRFQPNNNVRPFVLD